MKNILIFLTLATSFSCTHISSSIGGGVADLFVKAGMLDTAYSQDYDEILSSGGKLIYGKIKIYYDDRDITKHCSISLNDRPNRKGVGLFGDDSGFFLIHVESDSNKLKAIECRYKIVEYRYRFTYTFKNIEFKLRGDVGFAGSLDIHFTGQELDGPLRGGSYRSPCIKDIVYAPMDLEVKKRMEEKFEIRGDHFIDIGLM